MTGNLFFSTVLSENGFQWVSGSERNKAIVIMMNMDSSSSSITTEKLSMFALQECKFKMIVVAHIQLGL